MKRYSIVMLLLVLTVCIAGCELTGAKKNTGIGLKTAKDMFIATGTTAKNLCKSGILSDNDCTSVEALYTEGRQILLDAGDLWVKMAELDNFTANRDYEAMLSRVAVISGSIEAIIRRNTQ